MKLETLCAKVSLLILTCASFFVTGCQSPGGAGVPEFDDLKYIGKSVTDFAAASGTGFAKDPKPCKGFVKDSACVAYNARQVSPCHWVETGVMEENGKITSVFKSWTNYDQCNKRVDLPSVEDLVGQGSKPEYIVKAINGNMYWGTQYFGWWTSSAGVARLAAVCPSVGVGDKRVAVNFSKCKVLQYVGQLDPSPLDKQMMRHDLEY